MRIFVAAFLMIQSTGILFAQVINFDLETVAARKLNIEKIKGAETMSDLISGYPASWISGYLAVTLLVAQNGDTLKAVGLNEHLTPAQKAILQKASLGSDVIVGIDYLAENHLLGTLYKDRMNFIATVGPKLDAFFPGGREKLRNFIQESCIMAMNGIGLKENQMGIVKFFINAKGMAENIRLEISTGDEQIDALMLKAISTMPRWEAAEEKNGMKVAQEFVFRVGNLAGC